jgi:hypothetical protein
MHQAKEICIGEEQGLRYDDELFFLGAVLHDLGLTAYGRDASMLFYTHLSARQAPYYTVAIPPVHPRVKPPTCLMACSTMRQL